MPSPSRSQTSTNAKARRARRRIGAALVAAGLGLLPAAVVKAEPTVYLAPFYANTSKLNPQGQPLGRVA